MSCKGECQHIKVEKRNVFRVKHVLFSNNDLSLFDILTVLPSYAMLVCGVVF
jgi:hypothetical protein